MWWQHSKLCYIAQNATALADINSHTVNGFGIRNLSGNVAELTANPMVIKGGSGSWGAVPMPPNAVTKDEATTLVKWVLSQK